jgi:hypothetical protein
MKRTDLLPYDNRKNKGLMFFSSSSVKDTKLLYEFGLREILVSYHYISKSHDFYSEFLPKLHESGGLFMTDSGGFSFIASLISKGELTEETSKEEYWLPYLHEYVGWLEANAQHIFVAANLDLDAIVGREVVDKWNEKYFKPLEKHMNIIYVAHRDIEKDYNDFTGLDRFSEYCKKFRYVGVSQEYKKYANQVALIARNYKRIVHGFAWTSIPMLKTNPLFSVDSTTWLGGVRYGTSYVYDGKNFRVNDYKKKYLRKGDRTLCREFGIDYDKLMKDDATALNSYNLIGWLGARKEYLKAANLKLKTPTVNTLIR